MTFNKEIEEELRRSNEMLEALIKYSPLAIIATDMDTKVLIWNDAAERMFGYKREEVLGKKLPTVPEDDLEVFSVMKDKLQRGGSYVGKEVRRRRKDGTIFNLCTSVAPLRDRKRKVIGVIGILEDITERKLSEAEIRFKSQLLDNVKDSVFVVEIKDDRFGPTLYFNKAAHESRGYTLEEMKNIPIAEFVTEEYRSQMKQRIEEILRVGSVIFETAHYRKDGSVIDIENHSQLMDLGERKVITGVLRDISERKQTEEELRFKSRLLDNATDSVFVHDKGKIYYANEAAYKTRGYSRKEFLALPFKKVMTSEYAGQVDGHMSQLVNSNESMIFESAHYRKDGSIMPVEVHTCLIDYRDQKLAVSICRDISESKQAQLILSQSEARYRTLFEDAPAGVVLAERDGVMLRVNKAACKMLGYEEKDLLGMNLKDISYPEDMKQNLIYREQMLSGEINFFQMEKRYFHKDGHLVWGKLSVTKVTDYKTGAPLLVGQVEDITAQKLAETALWESEARFRTLFEDAPISLWEVDWSAVKTHIDRLKAEGIKDFKKYFKKHFDQVAICAGKIRVDNVNKATLDLYEAKDIGEFINGLNTVFTEDTLNSFMSEVVTFAEGGLTHSTENTAKTLKGKEVHLAVRTFIAPNHEKTWSKVLCANTDITKRIRSETALRQSEEKYRRLIEIANDAIFVTDAETGLIVEVNKRAEEMLGISRKKMVGTHHRRLHPANQAEYHTRTLKEYAEKGEGIIEGVSVVNNDGRLIPVEISASVVELGDKMLIQGIFRDVTERNRAKELSEALNNINNAIHFTLNFEEIMKRVVAKAGMTLGDSVGILLREDRYWTAKYFYGELEKIVGNRFTEDEVRAATLAELTRKPVISNDTLNDERFNQKTIRDYQMLSILAIPLLIREQVIGALYFTYTKEAAPFSDAEVDFGVKLGATVSLAIENARMYGSEHYIANTLQEALLQMPQKVPGIRFGYLYESATEAAKVGGDFFDLFALSGEKLGIVIGDVSGKGLEAASLTSVVKNSIKAYAQHDSSTASIVGKINDLIRNTYDQSMFVTLFFGILDTGTGSLKYSIAGHPPPIIISGSKEAPVALRIGSAAIGQLAGLKYIESKIKLNDEDVFFAYTDGVIEARSINQFFGEKRLLALLNESSASSPEKLPETIFKAVTKFTRGTLLDDVAILTVSLGGR